MGPKTEEELIRDKALRRRANAYMLRPIQYRLSNIDKELAERFIGDYVALGLGIASITAIFAIYHPTYWSDVALTIVCVVGIYYRIRWVAIGFLGYFLLSKILLFQEGIAGLASLPIAIICIAYSYLGILGVLRW